MVQSFKYWKISLLYFGVFFLALFRATFQALIITHHEKKALLKKVDREQKKWTSIWDSENKTEIDKLTMILIFKLFYALACYNVCTKSVFDFNSLFLFNDFCDTFWHFVTSNLLLFHAYMNQFEGVLRNVLLVIVKAVLIMFLVLLSDDYDCCGYFRDFNLPKRWILKILF